MPTSERENMLARKPACRFLRYSCCDWRWAQEGALARGEETGASPVSVWEIAGAAPGSDRRVLQRPEEPTPVAHLPNHSKPSGSDELPTRRLEDPNHSSLELYSPDPGRSAVPPFGPAAVEIVAGDPGKLPRKRCLDHRRPGPIPQEENLASVSADK